MFSFLEYIVRSGILSCFVTLKMTGSPSIPREPSHFLNGFTKHSKTENPAGHPIDIRFWFGVVASGEVAQQSAIGTIYNSPAFAGRQAWVLTRGKKIIINFQRWAFVYDRKSNFGTSKRTVRLDWKGSLINRTPCFFDTFEDQKYPKVFAPVFSFRCPCFRFLNK